MDELWKDSDAVAKEFCRLSGKRKMLDVVTEVLRRRSSQGRNPQQVFVDYDTHFSGKEENIKLAAADEIVRPIHFRR